MAGRRSKQAKRKVSMRKLVFTLLLGTALLRAGAAELAWSTDLPKAQAQAKAEKKMVLLEFTGSDW